MTIETVELSVPEFSFNETQILKAAVAEGVITSDEIPAKVHSDDAPLPAYTVVQSAVFLEEAVKVTFGNGLEKYIIYADFLKALNTSVLDNQVDSGGLPLNLPSNVFFISTSSSEIKINLYYTARTNLLKFSDPDFSKLREFEIVMPNLIIGIILKAGSIKGSWKVTSSKYFCTDLPVSKLPKTFINSVNHRDHIFLMPMSNTYAEGNMCFGGNTMPSNLSENNLRALDWYYQYLWESPFNSDLGVRSLARSSTSVKTWYEALKKKAEAKEPFPYSQLEGWAAI